MALPRSWSDFSARKEETEALRRRRGRSGGHGYAYVAAASLGLQTELAELGIRGDSVECERPAVRGTSVESSGRRRTRHVGVESERLESHSCNFGFHLALLGTPDSQAQRAVMGSA